MSDALPPAHKVKISWLIGVVAAFSIFALIAAYSSRMANDTTDYDQERAAVRQDNLKKVQEAENKLIAPVDKEGKPTAEWVDQAKGTVRIPIEEAMAKQIEVLKTKPSVIGAEIPGTAPAKPAPAPAPAPAATNAVPAAPEPAASTNAAPAKAEKTNKGQPAKEPSKPEEKPKASAAAPIATPTVPPVETPNK